MPPWLTDPSPRPSSRRGAIAAAPTLPVVMRRVLTLAAPTTLVAAVQALCQLVEPWLAARQGTASLAGWAVVLPFALLLQQMSTGCDGRRRGLRHRPGAGREAAGGSGGAGASMPWSSRWASAWSTRCCWPASRGRSSALIGGPEAAAAASAYCAWLFGAGAIPAWLANTLASVLRGGGRHALASRVLLLAWLCYPPLAWALMEPAGLGMAGAGMAFAVVMTAATAGMAVVVLRGGAGFHPTLRVKLQRALFGRILSVGLIACVMATIANLTTILVTARIAALRRRRGRRLWRLGPAGIPDGAAGLRRGVGADRAGRPRGRRPATGRRRGAPPGPGR